LRAAVAQGGGVPFTHRKVMKVPLSVLVKVGGHPQELRGPARICGNDDPVRERRDAAPQSLDRRLLSRPAGIECMNSHSLRQGTDRFVFQGREKAAGDFVDPGGTTHSLDIHTETPLLRQSNHGDAPGVGNVEPDVLLVKIRIEG